MHIVLECSTLLSKQHKLKKQMISVEILASPEAESSSTVVEVSGFSKKSIKGDVGDAF